MVIKALVQQSEYVKPHLSTFLVICEGQFTHLKFIFAYYEKPCDNQMPYSSSY